MGYKKIDKSLDFADFALASSLKHNHSLKLMEKIDKAINWSRVESILMSHYVVGTSSEGADVYRPLLLFKCLMLQKWFHINSDPGLENQINDRLSFKKFLSLPFSKPAPDHSTYSRFRGRLRALNFVLNALCGHSRVNGNPAFLNLYGFPLSWE